MSNPRQEAEKIAQRILATEFPRPCHASRALTLLITSALLEAEERGIERAANALDAEAAESPFGNTFEHAAAIVRSLKSPPPLKGGK